MSIYKAAKGAPYKDGDAQVIGETLERIGFSVPPEQFVEASRPSTSPTHKFFEWDDTAAAEAWRRQQARNLINHLLVIVKTERGPQATKAYHSVIIRRDDDDSEQSYCHMVNVAENEDLREQVLAKALAELNGWKARYAEWRSILTGVFEAIEEATERAPREAARRTKAKAGKRKKPRATTPVT